MSLLSLESRFFLFFSFSFLFLIVDFFAKRFWRRRLISTSIESKIVSSFELVSLSACGKGRDCLLISLLNGHPVIFDQTDHADYAFFRKTCRVFVYFYINSCFIVILNTYNINFLFFIFCFENSNVSFYHV